MKLKVILFSLFVFCLVGCETTTTDSGDLELTTDVSSNISSNGTELELDITSSGDWMIQSDAIWCTPVPSEGNGNCTIKLLIGANINSSERSASVTLSANGRMQTIRLTQDAADPDAGEYHYELPVIFHVLYDNEADENQYVREGWLAQILEICNQRYRNAYSSGFPGKQGTDINIEFVMAETDPDGNLLDEPGVDRRYWRNATIDCETFTSESNPEAAELVWDLNRYINIYVYTFTDQQILGITHLPYTGTTRPLEGLIESDYFYTNSEVNYPRGVSINNAAIYDLSSDGTFRSSDIAVTLSHELGHYLGLFHAFSSSDADDSDASETDYCDDTPDYDRSAYLSWLDLHSNNLSMNEAIRRVSTTGVSFEARNIMDYFWTLADEFTADQRARMRHVLENSPIIPGPKYEQTRTRSTGSEVEPPIRTMKLVKRNDFSQIMK